MSPYVVDVKTDAIEGGTRDGEIVADCVCGSGMVAPDKVLRRPLIPAWKTRHADCAPTHPDQEVTG